MKSPEMLTYGRGRWWGDLERGALICGRNKTIGLWKVLVRHSAVENFGLMIRQGRKEKVETHFLLALGLIMQSY